MKKSLKLLAAVGMLSMLISFVACDMQTEDQLLGTTTKEGEEKGNSSGGSKGSTGKKSPLWSKFEGADMQVWVDTATLTPTAECLEIKVKNSEWWGMCFCNKSDIGKEKPECVFFNMSNIAQITFEAKASSPVEIWVSQSDANADKKNIKKVNLTTSFETKTYTLQDPGSADYGVLDIGGDNNPFGTIISIKNIKFLDAAGNETVPSRNE